MAKLRRSMTILWLVFGLLVLAAPSWAQTRPPILEQLAKIYGLDSYGQIEAVRYTFNLELPALKVNLARTWTWEPKTGQVTYESKNNDGKPVKVTYVRSQLNSAPAIIGLSSLSTLTGIPAPVWKRRTSKNCRLEREQRN